MKKVGRNDPCPCGSGKKYKKCCEQNALGSRSIQTGVQVPHPKLSALFQKNVSHREENRRDLEKKGEF